MKTKKSSLLALFFLIAVSSWLLMSLSKQGKDTTLNNTNNSGIPGSANRIFPNNGPEFPHSFKITPSTDPGPLFHAPQNVTPDSIPTPQKGTHPQPQPPF